jgi:ABC-type transporter Mla subunit MlaD
MSEALIARIANALQAHRDTILSLQELASELQDFTSRARELADRLEAAPAVRATLVQSQPYEAPMDVTHMPMVLRGGPLKRDG